MVGILGLVLLGGSIACGSSPPAPSGVDLLVTRDQGAEVVRRTREPGPVPGATTASSLAGWRLTQLQGGRRWSVWVNGVRAWPGTRLGPGDRVWWDAGRAAPRAVVGSFPEPLRLGYAGRRVPVVLACAPGVESACGETERRLAAAGIGVSRAVPGASNIEATLRVLVAPWAQLRRDGIAGQLGQGPGTSGVFARFEGADRLVVLDATGQARRRVGPGAGLVAALAPPARAPTWVVTGTDPPGVLAAARRLDSRALSARFAVAAAGRETLAVPVRPPGAERHGTGRAPAAWAAEAIPSPPR